MLQLVVGPADEPVTLDELKAHLRAPSTSNDDDDMTRKIAAARRWFEKRTGLALISQQWAYIFDTFPSWCHGPRYLELEKAPIISVDSILSYDADNTETELDDAGYLADVASFPGRVLLNDGVSWPTDVRAHTAGKVLFTAGYGDAEDVPDDIKEAILQMAAYLYIDREGIGPIPAQVTATADAYELVTA